MSEKIKKYNEAANYPNNPLLSQGQAAMAQCVAPLLDHSVKLQRNSVSKFNDKGRPEHVQDLVLFPCVITPLGSTSRRATSSGDRAKTRFNVLYLPPQVLNIGDILEHATYGKMKIAEFDGYGQYGLTSAQATKLGGADNVRDGDSIRTFPRKTYW